MTHHKWKVFAILIVFLIVSTAGETNKAEAQAPVKYGSANRDVLDLQYRLKTLNLYKGPLDSHYGHSTVSAVKAFQKEYGTYPDGMTGLRTWRQLKKYTLSKYEVDMMAKVIYSEARGEKYKGQVAVGAVVMNRIQSDEFPDTMKGVVFQKNAFTAVSDGQYNLKPNQTAYSAALDAVRGWDPTKNSLYYFNPKTATSKWIWSRTPKVQIGKHVFAK